MVGLDNYLGTAKTPEGVRYDEKVTHEAGESAGHWKRSQQVAKRLRERARQVEEDSNYPAGIWVAVELRKLAEEIEGT